ncbi:Flagellar M-ring protein FliF [Candidatus Bealeia paramacronuclearis]|uniref:Flagellar M-ring protein n=1 Tax=Candidatus Bealeia paramacronuclearis TaxID=1921001 RepID=A0ABZ2C4Q0_9PROT|nr:Flagellar M-ring protein FliF [Candidatus Bealeia paramacronuclearis]
MNALVETLKGFGLIRLAIMGSVLAAMVGFFFMITARLSEPDYGLLFADIDPADGSQIVSRLDDMGVTYKLEGGGSQIFVPSEQVARLRMAMAEAGLPMGGSIGYELFDRTDVLGSTSFVQDLNRLRALEGELSRSIRSINGVSSARVHLVLPKKELFAREAQKTSASVIIKMRGAGRLAPGQVQGIQHLVAAAVPGLAVENISIIDERGTLLAKGSDGESAMAANLEEAKLNYESRVSKMLETLLERSVGPGKVRAEVSADLDMDRLTENSETYDPDGQVVRSTQTAEESANASESASSAGATSQNNVPNAQAAAGGGGGKNTNDSKRTEETINYEISKTLKTHIKESGGVKKISVAVLVDGVYTKGGDGKEAYAARPKEEMDQLTKLVKSAIGFDDKRGDTVEVVNMRFAPEEPGAQETGSDLFMGFTRFEIIRMIESIVLSLIALLGLLFVVRPIITRLLNQVGAASVASQDAQFALAGAGTGGSSSNPMSALPPGSPALQLSGPGGGHLPAPTESDEMMAIDNVIGKVRVSAVQKIEEIIDDKPEESVAQIRTWMREGQD